MGLKNLFKDKSYTPAPVKEEPVVTKEESPVEYNDGLTAEIKGNDIDGWRYYIYRNGNYETQSGLFMSSSPCLNAAKTMANKIRKRYNTAKTIKVEL